MVIGIPRNPQSGIGLEQIERGFLHMRTILLLEDEPCVMKLFRLILKPKGYLIIEHQTAEAAIRCAEHIDLLIADVSPPCSGINVATQLTAWMPGLRIILTSGYPQEMWNDQRRAELSAIPSDVKILRKPFTPAELLRMVHELIGPAMEIPTAAA
jgi:CheY-like chemotaxis protein